MKRIVLVALINCTAAAPAVQVVSPPGPASSPGPDHSRSAATATSMPIVCKVKTTFGTDLTLSFGDHAARVITARPDGTKEIDQQFSVETQWDGHKTGLVTGPGLSVKYDSDYGCIRNVHITTNTRADPGFIDELVVELCTGGSTSGCSP